MNTRDRDDTTLPKRLLPQLSAAQVDRVAGVTTETWAKAAIASDAVYGAAFDRVLDEMQKLRRVMLVGFVVMGAMLVSLTLGAVAFALSVDHRIDTIDHRLDSLEKRTP